MAFRSINIKHNESDNIPIYEDIFIRDLEGEVWRDVVGFDGGYKISNLGRLKCELVLPIMVKIFIVKQTVNKKRYACVRMTKDGEKSPSVRIHKLVAEAFIPNPVNKPTVNHKKGVKLDNRATELEWASFKENSAHAYKFGLVKLKTGQDAYNAKLRNEIVMDIFNATGKAKEITEKYKVHPNTVHDIKAGRSWGQITGKVHEADWNKSYHTKLTPSLVMDIFNCELKPNRIIAQKFDVDLSTVWRIRSGNSFSNVTGKTQGKI